MSQSARSPRAACFMHHSRDRFMTRQAEFAVSLRMNPLFKDGDKGDAVYGIRRGQIRIETGAEDGSRLTLNFQGSGDLFGEIAVLDGQARTADAIAAEPAEL